MLRHKFKAKPCEYENIKFASKKEAKRYLELKALKQSGEVICFIRQTPWHLQGNVKYISDFVVFWSDDTITIEDVKGFKTPMYILKKKQVETLYHITLTEI